MAEKTKRRGALVGQSAVAAGVATAVLLGGFGAFSLWNDSIGAGLNDDVQTGTLTLDSVDDDGWKIIETDGVLHANDAIDLATFKASPGDVIQYSADVHLTAEASDMLAQLTIDPASYVIDPSIASYVTVDISTGSEPAGPIAIDTTAGSQTVPVKVTVTFPSEISGLTGQTLASAVSLNGLDFALNQVAGS